MRIYFVAGFCALIVFLAALAIAAVLFGRIFGPGVPVRWRGILIAAELIVPGAIAFYTFQSIARHPWPRR